MKWTKDVIVTKAIKLRKEGNTISDIAKMVGVSTPTALKILRRHVPSLCNIRFRWRENCMTIL
jgi:orotate phosphoribosyltransferase-like protein